MERLSFAKVTGTTAEGFKEGKQCGELHVLVQVCGGSVEGGLKIMKTSEQIDQLGG